MNVMSDIGAQNLTRTLAEQARTLRYEDMPEDVRQLARQCLLDYLACTLAGAKEELTVSGAGQRCRIACAGFR
jgi:2-methylcitrate dehydratase PrpD